MANPTAATLTFKYHPKCQDFNGNGGPSLKSKGWLTVTVPDTGNPNADVDAAVAKLPPEAQARIAKSLKKSPESESVRGLIEDEAGMGIGFTLACVEWDEFQDDED
jgi:hypothetical protein